MISPKSSGIIKLEEMRECVAFGKTKSIKQIQILTKNIITK
jgi:hypothetical protein